MHSRMVRRYARSPAKCTFVAFNTNFLILTVYIGSAIHTSSISGRMTDFDISQNAAALTLYVLELPKIDCNPVYIVIIPTRHLPDSITGPVIGGFAAQANGWGWLHYELIWIADFTPIILLPLLPETYELTIRLKRAQELRKLT
ncbi:uncharacterized protein EV420DRAFT_1640974 [Desarmillaria tabescens]|uniref:Major facilitator superfamily (MFS) profile domain-containing protein n=1 Tax=Armillaria tabescens TaxID=1929756 RepID=A0AA39KHX2_ARMTA|nr:uncharacterized protein EV420DRAFT_1640974 [Desarmillaria tabescens]KAK0460425.1 hypothetical protein EV420DRAFT_1640974 [Desarmillaria tabescens]